MFIACVAYNFVFVLFCFVLFFMACVAFRLLLWRVSPSGCFHACVAFQLAISACVAYKLFSWRVSDAFRLFSRRLSPLGCFYGVCRRLWRVSLSLVSWCLSYFFSPFCVCSVCRLPLVFYGVCRLQVVFTAGVSGLSFRNTLMASLFCFVYKYQCAVYTLGGS